jgi:hypothetical protein
LHLVMAINHLVLYPKFHGGLQVLPQSGAVCAQR